MSVHEWVGPWQLWTVLGTGERHWMREAKYPYGCGYDCCGKTEMVHGPRLPAKGEAA